MADQIDESFLRGAFETLMKRAEGMAPHFAASGGKKLSDEEIETAWNTRALSVEQEWELWRQGNTPETAHLPKLTPEEIGLKVFPHREKLAKSGGRIEPKQFIGWANSYAERQFKKQTEPTEGEVI